MVLNRAKYRKAVSEYKSYRLWVLGDYRKMKKKILVLGEERKFKPEHFFNLVFGT